LNQDPKVSIIITCYNLERYIGEAIDSLLAQDSDFPFEVIVVDDASKDSSPGIIRSYTDPRIRPILLKENVGAASAINLAWKEAKGEYLCRFDGDDKWSPSYLSRAAAILDADNEVVLVHSDVAFIDGNGVVTSPSGNIARPTGLNAKDHEFKHILANYYINAPAIMARKTSWDAVLPWPEQFREGLGDWFCTLRMLDGHYSCFINEPLAYYRIHQTNMHRTMVVNGAGERNTRIILNHFQNAEGITTTEWKQIRFRQFSHLGFSYFGAGMSSQASRCLSEAIRYQPTALLKPSFLRIYIASLIGKERYERIKSVVTGR